MNIMPARYQGLHEAMAGLEKTGLPLVAYDGNCVKPAGFSDDIGIYYFIPKLAHAFNLTIDQSLVLFLGLIIVGSLLLGVAGFFLLTKSPLGRCIALAELLILFIICYITGDVYIAPSCLAAAVVPWFIYLGKKGRIWGYAAAVFMAGAGIGTAHYLRSHAGTAVLIFIVLVTLFFLNTQRWKKGLMIILLATGMMVPVFYFHGLVNSRDAYLKQTRTEFTQAPGEHPFWHAVYIGFGFLDNPYGIHYLDEVAIDKVRAISPETPYLSAQYEHILREEVFKLISEHPYFAIRTVFAKTGVVILYFLAFANIGLLVATCSPKVWSLEWAFRCALVFSALFGIAVMPMAKYLLGFNALAILYGIMHICQAIERKAGWKMQAAGNGGSY